MGNVCSKCGTALNDGAKFCTACGTQVQLPPKNLFCMNCGTQLNEGARFCVKCGTAVGQPQAAAPAGGNVCPKCGAETREGSKFCLKCGANVAMGAAQVIGSAVNMAVRVFEHTSNASSVPGETRLSLGGGLGNAVGQFIK